MIILALAPPPRRACPLSASHSSGRSQPSGSTSLSASPPARPATFARSWRRHRPRRNPHSGAVIYPTARSPGPSPSPASSRSIIISSSLSLVAESADSRAATSARDKLATELGDLGEFQVGRGGFASRSLLVLGLAVCPDRGPSGHLVPLPEFGVGLLTADQVGC